MSYPEPRYLGADGDATATVRRADQAPELPMAKATASYLATGASSGGKFGLYRWDFLGPRSGPDVHFHRSLSESFFILSGTVRVYDGTRWIDGNPGDFLYVPEGGLHAFHNESGEPASMLLLFAPGAPREGYFEGLAGLADMTDDEKEEFFLRHDTFWR